MVVGNRAKEMVEATFRMPQIKIQIRNMMYAGGLPGCTAAGKVSFVLPRTCFNAMIFKKRDWQERDFVQAFNVIGVRSQMIQVTGVNRVMFRLESE